MIRDADALLRRRKLRAFFDNWKVVSRLSSWLRCLTAGDVQAIAFRARMQRMRTLNATRRWNAFAQASRRRKRLHVQVCRVPWRPC
jgi:hypothetical protein